MEQPYQICTRCVMDTSAPDITFDNDGVCNYCTEFIARSSHIFNKTPLQLEHELDTFVKKVKAAGKNRPYDCIVGVSGGVDSSWVLVQAIKLGLRPLAVHMDNGWNSELAQNNISNLVQKLNVDLHTYVIDWEEYRSLMQAFFDADVIDVELLTDNAMLALNYRIAAKYRLHFILAGTNQTSEGMEIPSAWNWFKYDKKNIKALAKRFGSLPLKTFPAFSSNDYVWYQYIRSIKWISILDLLAYNKLDAMVDLQRDYGYKPYPYKHYESVFTRFYQGYILPVKFNVDKRKVHLATLVVSGLMSREDALRALEGIPYLSAVDLENDRKYFMKKMKWDEAQLAEYLNRKEQSHSIYGSERKKWNAKARIYHKLL